MTVTEFNKKLLNLEGLLYRFAMKLTANREDANDLLQDTFLKALTHRAKFEDSTNLKAWTFTIMKNTFINNYRKSTRQNTVFDSTKDLLFLSQNKGAYNVDPESAYCEKEIAAAIDNLDNEFKIAFKMYHQGYKYREISDILGVKIGTIKSRIFITRKKLAERLEGYAE